MKLEHLIPALLLLVGGCATRHDLEDVPVEGGTAEQREAVAQELAAFDRWIGPGRIRISRIELTTLPKRLGDAHGFYYRPSALVQLSADLDPVSIQQTLRHELCHAVDLQESLLDRPEVAFDTIASEAEMDADHVLHGAMHGSKRGMRAEVFAYVCQQAPLGTALLAQPCPDESSEYAEVARWVAERVWTGDPDVQVDAALAQSDSTVGWGAPSVVSALQVIGSDAADEAAILPTLEDTPLFGAFVSTVDGAEVPRVVDLTTDAIEAGYAVEPPYGAPELPVFNPIEADAVQAVSNGYTTLQIVRGLAQLSAFFAPRVVAHSGDGWSLVDGACPTRVSSVFLANDRLYVAWAEGADVLWAPVE